MLANKIAVMCQADQRHRLAGLPFGRLDPEPWEPPGRRDRRVDRGLPSNHAHPFHRAQRAIALVPISAYTGTAPALEAEGVVPTDCQP